MNPENLRDIYYPQKWYDFQIKPNHFNLFQALSNMHDVKYECVKHCANDPFRMQSYGKVWM